MSSSGELKRRPGYFYQALVSAAIERKIKVREAHVCNIFDILRLLFFHHGAGTVDPRSKIAQKSDGETKSEQNLAPPFFCLLFYLFSSALSYQF